MNQIMSISSTHNRSHFHPRHFYNWQCEYNRLLNEEAGLRRKLYSMDGEMGELVQRLNEIQTRMVELQQLIEGNACLHP